MPLYEFYCGICKKTEERIQTTYHPSERVSRCESCGSLMRLSITTPAVILKGEGWAKKDRRKKK